MLKPIKNGLFIISKFSILCLVNAWLQDVLYGSKLSFIHSNTLALFFVINMVTLSVYYGLIFLKQKFGLKPWYSKLEYFIYGWVFVGFMIFFIGSAIGRLTFGLPVILISKYTEEFWGKVLAYSVMVLELPMFVFLGLLTVWWPIFFVMQLFDKIFKK